MTSTMRAFVVTAPGEAAVHDVDRPVAGPGEVVVDVQRVGVCGTDVEFFTGEMQYLHDGQAHFPMRLGHEWMGTVASVGAGVDDVAQQVPGCEHHVERAGRPRSGRVGRVGRVGRGDGGRLVGGAWVA